MGKVLVTAQVENLEEWEAGFRTHGDLFKGQGIGSPIQLGKNRHRKGVRPGQGIRLLVQASPVAALRATVKGRAPDN